MRGRMRFGVLAVLALWLALVEGLLGRGHAHPVHAQTSNDVPPDVVALLPKDATVVSAISGDLTNDNTAGWAALFTEQQTTPSGYPITISSVAVVLPDNTGGWTVKKMVSITAGGAPQLSLTDVGGVNAVVFSGIVGAHSQQLIILRWRNGEIATIFDQTDNTPNMALTDLDGDGVPEVDVQFSSYCQAYYTAPRLVAVWGWNGFQYVEDTQRYPDAIAAAQADVQNAFQRAQTDNWRPDGVACLHGALAYLADKAGDQATAAAECATALSIDPTWSAEWAPVACGAAT